MPAVDFLRAGHNLPLFSAEKIVTCRIMANTVFKAISSDWRCKNVPLSITDMFVIDHNENDSLINHKIFVIKQGLFFFVIYHKWFCYYSIVWQNVPWLIEEKDGC